MVHIIPKEIEQHKWKRWLRWLLKLSYKMGNVKQMQYQQPNPDSLFYSRLETPLNIRLGLYFYHVSRSKKLINFLADLNLGVNYQKIVNVKKGIVQAVPQKKRKMEVSLYLALFIKIAQSFSQSITWT